MKVRTMMTRNPVCCTPETSVQAVADLMKKHDVGSVPVIADSGSRHLEGIVTDHDLCCKVLAGGLRAHATPVKRVMTRNPVTCKPEDMLQTCERLMQKNRIRRIPVVDENNSCVGIVALADLCQYASPSTICRTLATISKPNRSVRHLHRAAA
jgi:CBS domain-containing protein